jgi:hypothetical protein
MLRAIAYRGLDRRASNSVPPVSFGHLLTRVTHEDAFDAQPLTDRANGLLAVEKSSPAHSTSRRKQFAT